MSHETASQAFCFHEAEAEAALACHVGLVSDTARPAGRLLGTPNPKSPSAVVPLIACDALHLVVKIGLDCRGPCLACLIHMYVRTVAGRSGGRHAP